jgi:hypothetical protein
MNDQARMTNRRALRLVAVGLFLQITFNPGKTG